MKRKIEFLPEIRPFVGGPAVEEIGRKLPRTRSSAPGDAFVDMNSA